MMMSGYILATLPVLDLKHVMQVIEKHKKYTRHMEAFRRNRSLEQKIYYERRKNYKKHEAAQ